MFDTRDLNRYPPRFNVNDKVYVYRMTKFGGRIYEGMVLEVMNANGNYDANTVSEHMDYDAYNVTWKDNFGQKQEDWIQSYELLTEDQANEEKQNNDYYYENRD